jgi:hypothetical protein
MALARNYEYLLINPSNMEVPRLLFQVLMDCLKYPSNLKTSFELLEFWIEFKESLFEIID